VGAEFLFIIYKLLGVHCYYTKVIKVATVSRSRY